MDGLCNEKGFVYQKLPERLPGQPVIRFLL